MLTAMTSTAYSDYSTTPGLYQPDVSSDLAYSSAYSPASRYPRQSLYSPTTCFPYLPSLANRPTLNLYHRLVFLFGAAFEVSFRCRSGLNPRLRSQVREEERSPCRNLSDLRSWAR